jgi:hypothetical protein
MQWCRGRHHDAVDWGWVAASTSAATRPRCTRRSPTSSRRARRRRRRPGRRARCRRRHYRTELLPRRPACPRGRPARARSCASARVWRPPKRLDVGRGQRRPPRGWRPWTRVVVIEPSWPVFIAWTMSSASDSRRRAAALYTPPRPCDGRHGLPVRTVFAALSHGVRGPAHFCAVVLRRAPARRGCSPGAPVTCWTSCVAEARRPRARAHWPPRRPFVRTDGRSRCQGYRQAWASSPVRRPTIASSTAGAM